MIMKVIQGVSAILFFCLSINALAQEFILDAETAAIMHSRTQDYMQLTQVGYHLEILVWTTG